MQEQEVVERLGAKQRKEMKESPKGEAGIIGSWRLWSSLENSRSKVSDLNGKEKLAALHAQIQLKKKVVRSSSR